MAFTHCSVYNCFSMSAGDVLHRDWVLHSQLMTLSLYPGSIDYSYISIVAFKGHADISIVLSFLAWSLTIFSTSRTTVSLPQTPLIMEPSLIAPVHIHLEEVAVEPEDTDISHIRTSWHALTVSLWPYLLTQELGFWDSWVNYSTHFWFRNSLPFTFSWEIFLTWHWLYDLCTYPRHNSESPSVESLLIWLWCHLPVTLVLWWGMKTISMKSAWGIKTSSTHI